MADDPTAPLTAGQVARIFNVNPLTVARWADSGKLASFRTPGGQRRFRRSDVEAFLEQPQPADNGSAIAPPAPAPVAQEAS